MFSDLILPKCKKSGFQHKGERGKIENPGPEHKNKFYNRNKTRFSQIISNFGRGAYRHFHPGSYANESALNSKGKMHRGFPSAGQFGSYSQVTYWTLRCPRQLLFCCVSLIRTGHLVLVQFTQRAIPIAKRKSEQLDEWQVREENLSIRMAKWAIKISTETKYVLWLLPVPICQSVTGQKICQTGFRILIRHLWTCM